MTKGLTDSLKDQRFFSDELFGTRIKRTKANIEWSHFMVQNHQIIITFYACVPCVWDPRKWDSGTKLRLGIFLGYIIFVIVLIFALDLPHKFTIIGDWMQANPGPGVAIMILIFVVGTVLLFPFIVLGIAVGVIFHPLWVAFLVGFGGAVLGFSAAFLCGRYVLREWAAGVMKQNTTLQALERAFAREGWKLVLLLRLDELGPWTFYNYIFAATPISFWSHFWPTVIGTAPKVLLYAYIGSIANHFMSKPQFPNQTLEIVIITVSIVLIVTAIIFLAYFAKRAVEQALEEEEKHAHSEEREKLLSSSTDKSV